MSERAADQLVRLGTEVDELRTEVEILNAQLVEVRKSHGRTLLQNDALAAAGALAVSLEREKACVALRKWADNCEAGGYDQQALAFEKGAIWISQGVHDA